MGYYLETGTCDWQITWEAKHPVLIPFSLELRDITRENEYEMNF